MNKWRVKRRKQKRISFVLKLVLLLAALVILLFVFEAKLSPVIEAKAMQQVHNIALSKMAVAINQQISEHSEAGNYHTLMHIERDEQGKIVMMTADMPLLNTLVAGLIEDIDSALNNLGEQELTVPLMSVTGSKLLSSIGPDIPIHISGIATPSVKLSDSFVSAGINQTKHSIYLEVEAELQVAVPFQQETCTVATKVLLAEGIFIGDVPETFLQLDTSNGLSWEQ